MSAVVVTGGASDVLLEGHACVARVVEELLSPQHGRGQFFGGHAIQDHGCGRRCVRAIGECVEVVNRDGPVHKILDVERAAIR